MKTRTNLLLVAFVIAFLGVSGMEETVVGDVGADVSQTCTQKTSIPILDFGKFRNGSSKQRKNFARELLRSLVTVGFYYLKNHGIDMQLIEQTHAATKEFFKLDHDIKAPYDRGLKNPQGYKADGKEILRGRIADHKESITVQPSIIRNMTKNGHLEGEPLLQLWDQLVATEQELMRAYALALNQPEDIFSKHCGPADESETMSTIRVVSYPPHHDEKSMKCAAHTDFGLGTLLFQDDVGGLELWNLETKVWEPITPLKDHMVVNTGNLMQRWTNDLFISSLHRVVPNTNEDRTRQSVVFFGAANVGTICDPLDIFKTAKYAAIPAADYYKQLIAEAYGSPNVQLFFGDVADAFNEAELQEMVGRSGYQEGMDTEILEKEIYTTGQT